MESDSGVVRDGGAVQYRLADEDVENGWNSVAPLNDFIEGE